MKKNIFVLLFIAFLISFSLIFCVTANAEETSQEENQETTETEEETTENGNQDEVLIPEEPNTEGETTEETNFADMVEDFINKWASAIFGAIGGAGGMAIVVFILKKATQSLMNKVMSNADASEEQKKEAVAKLEESQKILENAEKRLTVKVDEIIEQAKIASEEGKQLMEQIVGANEETLSKFNNLKNELNQFKKLLGVLISTTPEFASNGVATKILELLDEGVDSNGQEEN